VLRGLVRRQGSCSSRQQVDAVVVDAGLARRLLRGSLVTLVLVALCPGSRVGHEVGVLEQGGLGFGFNLVDHVVDPRTDRALQGGVSISTTIDSPTKRIHLRPSRIPSMFRSASAVMDMKGLQPR